jgi:hypothetical protein
VSPWQKIKSSAVDDCSTYVGRYLVISIADIFPAHKNRIFLERVSQPFRIYSIGIPTYVGISLGERSEISVILNVAMLLLCSICFVICRCR